MKLKNYVIINGKECRGNDTKKKYAYAVVASKNGNHSVHSLSGSLENAEKVAKWNHKDCLKMTNQGYTSQAGWSFAVHKLISEPI